MKISMIVPLHGEMGSARELYTHIQGYSSYRSVKEIILISTNSHDPALAGLGNNDKVKTFTFAGATSIACLEAGAFEATGDILFFLKPGTFPRPQFDQLILESLQGSNQAGILAQDAPASLWQKIRSKLPLRCALCFIKVDNFFTTRRFFHLKSRQLSRQLAGSFSEIFHRYAISFKAAIV